MSHDPSVPRAIASTRARGGPIRTAPIRITRTVIALALAAATLTALPAAAYAQGSSPITLPGSTTTAPPNPNPTPTTTTPPATVAPATPGQPAAPGPQAPPSTAPPSTASPGSPGSPAHSGVPAVPVGGPPTSTTVPGAPPPPPPDPGPVLGEVQGDLAQLTAIDDYKPAQTLVAQAQQRVTTASASLQSARRVLQQAQDRQAAAGQRKGAADSELRALAIEAYIGVGYSTPMGGHPASGNGNQGFGTVSTPEGLTGVEALDANEMLLLVGERARRGDDQARSRLDAATKATARAQAAADQAQQSVGQAEADLLSAQQTLKVVTAAATNATTASATALPDLTSTGGLPATTQADPVQPAKSGIPGAEAAAAARLAPSSPAIMGRSAMDGSALAAWFQSTGHQADVTVPITDLANAYQTWGQKLGVAYDLAFAQSVVETGYFSFPAYGQLTPKDNNFAGIGACDSCAHGWSFPDASTGVQAQIELLYDYATAKPLPAGVKNVIGGTGVGGCCSTWMALAGTWASSLTYGISIMTVYNQMLTWYIPQAELSAGVIAPSTPAAQGPSLAPLPGAAATPAAAAAAAAKAPPAPPAAR